MSIWGSLLGGVIGFSFGGPFGALLGSFLGGKISRLSSTKNLGKQQNSQEIINVWHHLEFPSSDRRVILNRRTNFSSCIRQKPL